jgi:hypothetical protein
MNGRGRIMTGLGKQAKVLTEEQIKAAFAAVAERALSPP